MLDALGRRPDELEGMAEYEVIMRKGQSRREFVTSAVFKILCTKTAPIGQYI